MKPLLFVFHLLVMAPAILGQPFGLTMTDISDPAGGDAQLFGYLILFGISGLGLALVGYKLFDLCIVGDNRREPPNN